MKPITEKYIAQSADQKMYTYYVAKLNEEKSEQLEEMLLKFEAAGATRPLNWAWSELSEGIPQWARFMILKEMYQSAHDITGNVEASEEFDQKMNNSYQEITAKVGSEKLHQFLTAYAKGMLYNMLGVFDEGSFDYESKDSWLLVTHNRETGELGKAISGLHEDFLEFGSEIEINRK